MYDFDSVIDRTGSNPVKYDKRKEVFGTEDLLPMWVSDMVFKNPPEVIEEAKKKCDSGVCWYRYRSWESIVSFIRWTLKRHGWKIKPEWISSAPGIVTALPLAIRVFTEKGDKVLIQTPVYPPFFASIKDTERTLVTNPLILNNGVYEIDWNDFETKIKSGVKMFILCSPHNPIGRVWSKEELSRIGEYCIRYNVIILSDEIHSDLALFGNKHTPIASISKEISAITLTTTAPSKSFNIAGMMNSIIVSSSEKLLDLYNRELYTLRLETGNLFAHITMEAAYNYGEKWLEELIPYLENNIKFTSDFLQTELPEITFTMPQASFLIWLDFRKTGYSHKEVSERLIKISKLGLNDGEAFGKDGIGFRRMNLAAPLSVVKEGLERLKIGFKK